MADEESETADDAPSFADQVSAVREAFSEEDRAVRSGGDGVPDPTGLLDALAGGGRERQQATAVDLAPLIRELQHLREEVTRIGVALEELTDQRRD
jgi:hypothetical protein